MRGRAQGLIGSLLPCLAVLLAPLGLLQSAQGNSVIPAPEANGASETIREQRPAPAVPAGYRFGVAAIDTKALYIRLADLSSDLPKLVRHLSGNTLVLDLRFVTATLGEAEAFLRLFSPPADPLRLEIRGDWPTTAVPLPEIPADGHPEAVFVLVNQTTAGPIEAALDLLQARHRVLGIGLVTAGETARYQPLPDRPGHEVRIAEALGAEGRSLHGRGFQPHLVPSELTAEADRRGYASWSAGSPLRLHPQTPLTDPDATEDNGTEDPPVTYPTDPALEKAWHTLLALRATGLLSRPEEIRDSAVESSPGPG
ncbi:MAG: hypothetical protein EA425_15030 [Puniceicoccaceae bacterium]|nr:MAG: hypothetical protein EA425_15030 [Puniceicoccaceae bacterium]